MHQKYQPIWREVLCMVANPSSNQASNHRGPDSQGQLLCGAFPPPQPSPMSSYLDLHHPSASPYPLFPTPKRLKMSPSLSHFQTFKLLTYPCQLCLPCPVFVLQLPVRLVKITCLAMVVLTLHSHTSLFRVHFLAFVFAKTLNFMSAPFPDSGVLCGSN